MSSPSRKNVKVVVLGDIGRSPRMQYHSLSFAEANKVDIIGYGDTNPMDEIKTHPAIQHHYLLPLPVIPVRLLNYLFKTILQTLNLLFLLFLTTRSDYLIVQNPPAIPSLIICWFYARVVKATLIIDWHNYAHTIMALSVGKNNVLVKVTKQVEAFVGQRADFNFCVTKAMKEDLRENCNIKATTLSDRPPLIFKPISLQEKRDFLSKFSELYGSVFVEDNRNVVVDKTGQDYSLRDDRPAILVSSTSWTPDEDFSILLQALTNYEAHCKEGNDLELPKLVCIITGKGPLKAYYQQEIEKAKWEMVKIITPWLDSEHYPLVLASADLGVSLHTSSSGLDLPMKVVDMFGCGLPVCAHNFKCLNELVKHGENGYIFNSIDELTQQIFDWFEKFPNNPKQQELERKFKTELKTFQDLRWQENWNNILLPTIK